MIVVWTPVQFVRVTVWFREQVGRDFFSPEDLCRRWVFWSCPGLIWRAALLTFWHWRPKPWCEELVKGTRCIRSSVTIVASHKSNFHFCLWPPHLHLQQQTASREWAIRGLGRVTETLPCRRSSKGLCYIDEYSGNLGEHWLYYSTVIQWVPCFLHKGEFASLQSIWLYFYNPFTYSDFFKWIGIVVFGMSVISLRLSPDS